MEDLFDLIMESGKLRGDRNHRSKIHEALADSLVNGTGLPSDPNWLDVDHALASGARSFSEFDQDDFERHHDEENGLDRMELEELIDIEP